MELSNLLSAMVQGAETDTLAQIQSRGQGGANALAQTGSASGSPGDTLNSQTALTIAGQPPMLNVTGQAAGQPGLAVGQPGSGLLSQPGPTVAGQPGAGIGLPPGTSPSAVGETNLPALIQRAGFAGPGADTYHGSEAPASPSLLSQSGVGAYIQLLNAFASHEVSDKSANLVTNNLGTASATLKSA